VSGMPSDRGTVQLRSHPPLGAEHSDQRERPPDPLMREPVDLRIPRGVASPEITAPMLVRFDGSCQPPGGGGVAGWGFVVEGPGIQFEDCGLATRPYSPHSTNNVAEYVGAIRALEDLHSRGYSGEVIVEGDSQLVIRQMNGDYQVKAEHLKAYHDRLAQLAGCFAHVEFRWIPREDNMRADALSKRAVEVASEDAKRYRPAPTVRTAETEPGSGRP
jgi:ribonuclease HI